MSLLLGVVVLVNAVCAILASREAKKRDYNERDFLIAGLLCGPVALHAALRAHEYQVVDDEQPAPSTHHPHRPEPAGQDQVDEAELVVAGESDELAPVVPDTDRPPAEAEPATVVSEESKDTHEPETPVLQFTVEEEEDEAAPFAAAEDAGSSEMASTQHATVTPQAGMVESWGTRAEGGKTQVKSIVELASTEGDHRERLAGVKPPPVDVELPSRPLFGSVQAVCEHCRERTKHDRHAVCRTCGKPNQRLVEHWDITVEDKPKKRKKDNSAGLLCPECEKPTFVFWYGVCANCGADLEQEEAATAG